MFEHENYKLEKFIVTDNGKNVTITEPQLDGKSLIDAIEFYYRNIYNYLEQLIVIFFGLHAYYKSKGNMTLFQNLDYDYSKLRYKYTILPKIIAGSNVKQIIKP